MPYMFLDSILYQVHECKAWSFVEVEPLRRLSHIKAIRSSYTLYIFSKYCEVKLLDFVTDVYKPLQSLKKWFQTTTSMI